MAGKKGRSGGARFGAGRKPNAWYAEHGIEPGKLGVKKLESKPRWIPPARPCHVYVIHEADNSQVCKIGIANNPARRLSALQVAHYRELVLAYSVKFGTEKLALDAEKHVHELFRSSHCRGEWFGVSAEEAVEAVRCAASIQEAQLIHDEES